MSIERKYARRCSAESRLKGSPPGGMPGNQPGGSGLVFNSIVAAAFGLYGPFLALAAGAAAGYIASQQEKPPSKADGARLGATAGAFAGALVFVGQIAGAV